jgi:hypothetical protein
MLKQKYIRVIFLILSLVVMALVMVWIRAFYGSMQAYHQGEVYLKEHQYIKAITFFDRSIHWYAPFNPYVRQSAQRLWEIALSAEQEGDIRLALIAIRTVRRGFYASRSFYTPRQDWIKKCDAKINELMEIEPTNREMLRGPASPDKSIPTSQEATSLSTPWSIIVEIGFLGWIGSAIGLLLFACKGEREARFLTSQAIAWGPLTLTLWLIGMIKA